LNKGKSPLDGSQIISEQWINASVTPHIKNFPKPGSNYPISYGYQWWIPEDDGSGDFLAIGVYNQFIYVNPKYNIVIAKNSAYSDYPTNIDVSELLAIAAFRTIAKEMK
jgi:CubicO group peptidase (beta-lactamase class C family)